MAMMATWCVICGLLAGQIHAKTMENELSDSDQGASFAPMILTDDSAGDQDVSLAFKTWTSGKPESWLGEAMKVGSVGAQQRLCFVDGWEFQATNIFWMADAASPLGQLNITLTCPDAGKMMSRFQKVLEDEIVAAKGALSDADTMGQIAAAKEKEADLISLQELAKSDPQQAAAKGLAEGMIHSEALRETAKALLDSEVQSKFHQIHMASHVFMIIPLVHTSTSRGSHALGEEVVNLINGGSLEWKNIKEEMHAAISHSGGSDIIAFENAPTKSRKFATTMENTTMKNFKAAAGTTGIKVKVHVMDRLNMYNPMQLQERKYIFLPLIAAILVIPLTLFLALDCQFIRFIYDRVVTPSTLLLQAFCIFGPPTAAQFGFVDCGVGVPWELHTAFAVLVAAYAFSNLVLVMRDDKEYFQEKAKGKMCEWMCECCPPLPYCGFEALVKIEFYVMDMCMERFDFYSDVVFVFIAYSCHWEWANASAVVLVIATLGQAVGVGFGWRGESYRPEVLLSALLGLVPHPVSGFGPGLHCARHMEEIVCHALARVVLEDLPQVALQIVFSYQVRKDPFVLMSAGVSIFFGLKKLHEVIKFFCCEKKKSGYEKFELQLVSDSSDW